MVTGIDIDEKKIVLEAGVSFINHTKQQDQRSLVKDLPGGLFSHCR